MTPEEATDNQHALAKALIDGLSMMEPVFDSADGMRADLERRGWSPTAAEDIAHQWLINVMQQVWSS